MLEITISKQEYFDESCGEFVYVPEQHLTLEHSLVSLSKWESKWHKPFLQEESKTIEESLDYIRCMTVNKNVNPLAYRGITPALFKQINDYIDAPMTATWFSKEQSKGGKSEVITSELIYYWMIALQIPVEFEKWHLNRLITLIKVCNIKNAPPKKMSRREIMERNRRLNSARKKKP
jgi:hypothetical protein